MGTTATLAPAPHTPTTTRGRRGRAGIVAVVLTAAFLLGACMSPDQQTAFDKVNASRTTRAVPALHEDETANSKAQQWAEHLASIGRLEHSNLASGMDRSWKRLGENVGYSTKGISAVHQQFMTSTSHRANILNRQFTHVGVGVAHANGRTYVVQVFVQR